MLWLGERQSSIVFAEVVAESRRDQIGTEERRSESIYGREGGAPVPGGQSTLGSEVHSLASEIEPHIDSLPRFGGHLGCESQGNTL